MGPLAQPAGDERALADAWLDLHRQTLLWKCGGLTAQQRNIQMSLRFVYSVMIQEYARHNGHADLLREAIDGQTGH